MRQYLHQNLRTVMKLRNTIFELRIQLEELKNSVYSDEMKDLYMKKKEIEIQLEILKLKQFMKDLHIEVSDLDIINIQFD